jgi:PAS domain S-box-containing protein
MLAMKDIKNSLLKIIFNYTSDAIFALDLSGNFVLFNSQGFELIGYPEKEIIGKHFSKIISPVELPWLAELFKDVILFGATITEFSLKIIGKKNVAKNILLNVLPYFSGNKIIGLVGIGRNITLEKNIQDFPELDRKKLFSILESIPGFVYLQSPDYKITYANKTFKELFGVPLGDKTCYEVINGLNAPCKECPTFRVFETKAAQSWEWQDPKSDEYFMIYDYPFTDLDGTELVLELGIDISERKRLENQLRENEIRYRTLAENTQDIISRFDSECRYLYVNSAIAHLIPMETSEVIGKTHHELGFRDQFCAYREARIKKVFQHQKSMREQFEFDGREGKITLDWLLVPELDQDETVKSVLSTERDITLMKKREQELQQALQDKDFLMREVHHRVKNNLLILESLVSLQAAQISSQETKECLKNVEGRIRTLSTLHEKLYQTSTISSLDTKEYFSSLAQKLYDSLIKDPLRIHLNLDIISTQLHINTLIPCGLIVNELLTNALKYAFPKNSRGEVRLSFTENPEKLYVLTLQDNGQGLPADFDLNRSGGFGLRVVKILVRQLDGKLDLTNDQGTKFQISFTSIP